MNELNFCPKCSKELVERIVNGRNRKYCTDCESAVYENPVPATGAVCFDEEGKILLVRRSVEPKKGMWCLPGGFVETDETPEEGCLRELTEETGLFGKILSGAKNVRSESPFYSSVIVMGYLVEITGGELAAGDDSSDAGFFKMDNLPQIAFESHSIIIDHFQNERFFLKKRVGLSGLGAYVITSGDHVRVAEDACGAGARIVQYRDKDCTQAEKLETAKKIEEICRKYGTIFVVNDDISVAILSGADGVHLGQDDLSITDARKIVPKNFIVGKSTHSLKQALAAEKEGAGYIGIGPVFRTPTKKDYIPVGVELAEEVVKRVKIPVVAIGGLNLENIHIIKRAGVKNVAMVREFEVDTFGNVKKVNELLTAE